MVRQTDDREHLEVAATVIFAGFFIITAKPGQLNRIPSAIRPVYGCDTGRSGQARERLLSGFLITHIPGAGTFSVLVFHERRMWRILPAVLAMAASQFGRSACGSPEVVLTRLSDHFGIHP